MTKFKLELFKKKPTDKLAMGATHIAAMAGNPNYPAATRVPTDAQVQTAQDDLAAAESAVDANNCEAVTPNDAAALASTGFPLRSGGGPIGSLPAPGDLRATPTANAGEIELRCDTVKGSSSYEWECKLHDNLAAPWTAVKTSTTTKILVTGLTPGALYAFRVRAIGSAGPGTWSDEATGRAP